MSISFLPSESRPNVYSIVLDPSVSDDARMVHDNAHRHRNVHMHLQYELQVTLGVFGRVNRSEIILLCHIAMACLRIEGIGPQGNRWLI